MVNTSHRACVGWLKSVRPLITGTVACSAKRVTVSWWNARISTASTIRDSTSAVSLMFSFSPRWISPGLR